MTKIITSGESGQNTSTSREISHFDQLIVDLQQRERNGSTVKWEDFSFELSQGLTSDIEGNLSDLVIEEREEK